MSKLEFVAIQFGVKFIATYNLWHYVDRVCQRYLHFPYLSRKLCYFAKLFHDFISFLFYFILFSRSYYFIPYKDLRPWIAILSMESYLRNLIGYNQEGETAWPPTEFSPS